VTYDRGYNFVLDTPYQSTGPGMLVYDMDLYDSIAYAACFYGGLIYSLDDGQTWQNLFADTIAENDFDDSLFQDLNNRYFSVAIDTNYTDTIVVWAGTAYGINQYQFIRPAAKLASNYIVDLEYDEDFTWIATDRGLSRNDSAGVSYKSIFKDDGLPGDYISTVESEYGITVCAGYEPETDSSIGLALSADSGQTWTKVYPEQAVAIF